LLGYDAAILWRGIIWPCGAFEGGQIISVPPFTLERPAVRISQIVIHSYLIKDLGLHDWNSFLIFATLLINDH